MKEVIKMYVGIEFPQKVEKDDTMIVFDSCISFELINGKEVILDFEDCYGRINNINPKVVDFECEHLSDCFPLPTMQDVLQIQNKIKRINEFKVDVDIKGKPFFDYKVSYITLVCVEGHFRNYIDIPKNIIIDFSKVLA